MLLSIAVILVVFSQAPVVQQYYKSTDVKWVQDPLETLERYKSQILPSAFAGFTASII